MRKFQFYVELKSGKNNTFRFEDDNFYSAQLRTDWMVREISKRGGSVIRSELKEVNILERKVL